MGRSKFELDSFDILYMYHVTWFVSKSFVCFLLLTYLFLQEIVVGSNMDKIYIVMDYVEHDLKVLMEHMTQGFRIGKSTHEIADLLTTI